MTFVKTYENINITCLGPCFMASRVCVIQHFCQRIHCGRGGHIEDLATQPQ